MREVFPLDGRWGRHGEGEGGWGRGWGGVGEGEGWGESVAGEEKVSPVKPSHKAQNTMSNRDHHRPPNSKLQTAHPNQPTKNAQSFGMRI